MPISDDLDLAGFQLDLDQLEAEFEESPSFQDITPSTRALDDLCNELDWLAPSTPTPRHTNKSSLGGSTSLLSQAALNSSTTAQAAHGDWKRVRRLACGSAGETWLVRRQQGGPLYAMKEISRTRLYSDDELMAEDPSQSGSGRNPHAEVEILSKVCHPHVVEYLGSFQKSRTVCILMEFCSGGDLQAVIKTQQSAGRLIDQSKVLLWTRQMLLALRHCHKMMILHRDMKPANVFLTDEGSVKLGDFGISCQLEHSGALTSTHCGTPCYYSPERCRGEKYGTPSDVWALGCVLFELLCLEKAFRADNLRDLVGSVLDHPAPLALLPEGVMGCLREAVEMMLEKSPDARASVEQLLDSIS